jgi:hypothetical protein
MFDRLFTRASTVAHHATAPYAEERARYLRERERGISPRSSWNFYGRSDSAGRKNYVATKGLRNASRWRCATLHNISFLNT